MTTAGQGGARDAGAGALTSGLPVDKRLSDLNAMQAMQVCDYAQRARAQLISIVGAERITCLYQALAKPGVVEGMTVNPQACQAAVDACVAALPAPGPAARSFSCAPEDVSPIWTSCDLTVGTMESCVAMLKDGLGAQYATFSCEHLANGGAPMMTAPAPPAEPTAVCGSFFNECPGLLGIADLPWPGAT